jgi:nucleoside-diphosphate-sugar epimerase
MKAFVTGATGFIGSHLVDALLKKGVEVTCLVRASSSLEYLEGLNVKLVRGDCCEADAIFEGVKNSDYIFHIAGLTKAKNSGDFHKANVVGTENLLNVVLKSGHNIKRFFHLSSLAAAGPSYNGIPLKEDCEPTPVSDYGRSKYEGERLVYSCKDKVPITIIRPPAVYGPKDKDMLMFFRMINKGVVPYWGKSFYSFIYVEDLINGIIESSLNKEAEGEIFFISDGGIYSSDDVVNAVSDAVEKKPLKLPVPDFIMPLFGSISERFKNVNIINSDKIKELKYKNWTCDSGKINKLINFTPRVKMKEGARWTADWYRIHKWL